MKTPFKVLLVLFAVELTAGGGTPTNSWRGITPFQSSAGDVAQVFGVEASSLDLDSGSTFEVQDGRVTINFVSPSLAKIYKAPRSMIGKVITIYFKPADRLSLGELRLSKRFRRCTEQMAKRHYYMLSDQGVAYQLARDSDSVEMIIYQPTRAEVGRLAVNTECVF